MFREKEREGISTRVCAVPFSNTGEKRERKGKGGSSRFCLPDPACRRPPIVPIDRESGTR